MNAIFKQFFCFENHTAPYTSLSRNCKTPPCGSFENTLFTDNNPSMIKLSPGFPLRDVIYHAWCRVSKTCFVTSGQNRIWNITSPLAEKKTKRLRLDWRKRGENFPLAGWETWRKLIYHEIPKLPEAAVAPEPTHPTPSPTPFSTFLLSSLLPLSFSGGLMHNWSEATTMRIRWIRQSSL